MTAEERDALIERAMQRLGKLREREDAEPKPEAIRPSGVVKGGR